MNLPRKTIQVEPAHLPACCPPPEQDGWDQHPRVYLQLSEKTPRRQCPYCGAMFVLRSAEG